MSETNVRSHFFCTDESSFQFQSSIRIKTVGEKTEGNSKVPIFPFYRKSAQPAL